MKIIKETRERYARFFYRCPEGESAADVFDRISVILVDAEDIQPLVVDNGTGMVKNEVTVGRVPDKANLVISVATGVKSPLFTSGIHKPT
ncbi:hypothetical protein TSUD_296750 [Trifolium subterraneum]|uniref:Uncharacterized protein n=1 Tax=Trifolium subterraneum TaxID=3900 RepID=A0A2Z6NTF3_TRISU|nr:hypothetical protein TSUD_296750 [Trifolium subterraneum]